MLIWVTALHCEAKPVIDYYRLKKSQDDSAFDIYHGENMACIISGIGKVASAAATAWIAARHDDETSLAWINLGTAGAAEHEIGAAFLLNQVIDADSGQRYYPAPGAGSSFAGGACMTLSLPSVDYRESYLYDLEASGFIYSALRFSSAELTQSIKIVSDNRQRQIGKNRQQVSDLVHQHIEQIDRQATSLLALDNEIVALGISAEAWQRLLAMAHFTQTQKNRLRVLWRYVGNRDFDDEGLLRELAVHSSADRIIETLEQISFDDSESL